MPGRIIYLKIIVLMLGLILFVSAAAAEDLPMPKCFVIQGPSGGIQQVCQSHNFVTIEAVSDASASGPSAAALRAHQVSHDDVAPGPPDPSAPPREAKPADWSGLRVGGGPLGVLRPANASGFGLVARLSYDVALHPASPLTLGIALAGAFAPNRNRKTDPAESFQDGVAGVTLRVGYALTSDIMAHLDAGVAAQTRDVSLANGGGTVGAGLAYAIDDRWSLDLDYSYIDRVAQARQAVPVFLRQTRGAHALSLTLDYKLF